MYTYEGPIIKVGWQKKKRINDSITENFRQLSITVIPPEKKIR